MGKILVIEGTDCSGKSTQYEQLCERLNREGIPFTSNSFPDYDLDTCVFVKDYLAGEYGDDPSKLDPKTVSTFYSLDRYASYMKRDWGKVYRDGGNVLFARYMTSNFLHQACKLKTEQEKEELINWLLDFEVNVLKIPMYDDVILLNMPPHLAKELRAKRGQNSSGGAKDIHEDNEQHLLDAYNTSIWVAKRFGWTIIDCADKNGNLRSIDAIHEDIYKKAKELFSK